MRSAQMWRRFAFTLTALAFCTAGGADAAALSSINPRIKPAAPGPVYVSRADLDRLQAVRDALDRRRWDDAKVLAQTIADPTAKNLAQWFYFYAEDPDVSMAEADVFLDAHSDWPALTRIQLDIEREIDDNTPASAVLGFFDTRDPITGEGKIQLARALFTDGDREAGELRVRDAWVNHEFSLREEQKILSAYSGLLTPEDHAARVDRLLWSRQVTAARRTFPRLTSDERRKAEARAALLLAASNGPRLFEALPESERMDPGVLLAAVRYYRRAEEEPRAVALARLAPADPALLRNPSRWWDETQLLMRWALTEKRYEDAYAMASGHGLEPGGDFAEAEFNAGWIALRFLGAPERAETHFAALAATVGAPISLARAYYWLGRAKEAQGENALADAWYARAAEHIYTYYGQLAAEKIGAPAVAQTFDAPITPTAEDKAAFGARPAVAALRILSDLGEDRSFLIFAYQVDDELQSPGEYVELAELAAKMRAPHISVRAGKVGVGRDAFAAEVAYPLVYIPEEAARFVPSEYILGISRQESEFNPRAYSSAGARGMMQLIPSTAQLTARKEGITYRGASDLFDPVYNVTLGSAHLSHLFERFNGSRIMSFAGYNAGPNRVAQWIERYGDPRAPGVDPIDWVEQIPFAETRNYVQRVLENAQIYRARLNETPIAGGLRADLEVGGPTGRAGAGPSLSTQSPLPPLPARTAKFAEGAPPARASVAPPPAPSGKPAAPSADAAPDALGDAINEAADAEDADGDIAIDSDELSPADEADFLGDETPAPIDSAPNDSGDRAVVAPAANSAITNTNARDASAADECETYRAYMVSADKEETSAADLNAGMLAELKSGGPAC